MSCRVDHLLNETQLLTTSLSLLIKAQSDSLLRFNMFLRRRAHFWESKARESTRVHKRLGRRTRPKTWPLWRSQTRCNRIELTQWWRSLSKTPKVRSLLKLWASKQIWLLWCKLTYLSYLLTAFLFLKSNFSMSECAKANLVWTLNPLESQSKVKRRR